MIKRAVFAGSLVLAIMVVVGVPVTAAPSFFGYTGLVATPTADALSTGEYNVGVFWLNIESGVDSNTYFTNLGLAEGLEVGFTRVKPKSASGETWVNAKYNFMPETEARPAVAAGVFDFTNEMDVTTYIVMSKSFRWRDSTRYGEVNSPRFHLGIGGGQINGLFGGVSVALGDRLLVMGEYDSNDFNFGARLAVTEEIRVHAGLLGSGDDLSVGVTFNKRR